MQKVMYINDIDTISDYIEPEVIDYIADGQTETFECFDNFDIIAFDWYDIDNIDNDPSQIMIYIDKDDIFILCESDASYKKSSAIFKGADTNERALYLFFHELFKGDTKNLEKMEDEIAAFEDEVLTGHSKKSAEHIIAFRTKLLQLKKYYEQLDDIFECLTDNDNELISEPLLKYFTILGSRTSRFVSAVTNLREYITQVREAYQAQIDIEQNQLMKVFTIITSIFLPLTLIVGWYGMNFNMPEFGWKYGYAMVILLSVIICAALTLIFKKKKWF